MGGIFSLQKKGGFSFWKISPMDRSELFWVELEQYFCTMEVDTDLTKPSAGSNHQFPSKLRSIA